MTTASSSDALDGFVRVHPLTPFVRGGLVVLGVLGYLVSQQVDRIVGAMSDMPDGGEGGGPGGDFPLLQVGIFAVSVLGVILLALLSWWFTRYRVGEESLEMRRGAIFRSHRQVPYDRIQAVDLVRPLLARVTGLAEVRVESAGGGDSHVEIAYLRVTEAEEVRLRILGLAEAATGAGPAHGTTPGGEGPDGVPDAAAPADLTQGSVGHGRQARPERHLLSVPADRIIASVLLSWDTILLGIFFLAAGVLAIFDLTPVIGGFLPIVAVNVFRAGMRLTRWYGLTLGLRGDTLTSKRGLTDTRASSVPLHRVQALAINQPVLWRRAGWWSLEVNIAGAQIGSASGDDSDSVLVPVATTREVLDLLEVVTADPETTAEVASLVEGTPRGFVGQPRRARWLHPFAWRRIGYLPGRRAAITRAGWIDHELQVVPWGRIQSLTVDQGLVARRLRLANVHFVSTVGPVSPRVRHLDGDDAERLRQLAARRSSHARRRSSGPVGCDPAPDTVDCAR